MSASQLYLIPAPLHRRVLGALILAAALVYLLQFIDRGWVPHDEGMLGQSAELVLAGAVPHVDYQEPYTGGLSWFYAGLFAVTGIDLLHVRWLLFAGAAVALMATYSILRRHIGPFGAAFGGALAIVWSFPNYFAGLPSWWVLICAILCLWAITRHIETRRIRFVCAAGLAVGIAILIKQTGVYLLAALAMSLAFQREPTDAQRTSAALHAAFRLTTAGGAFLLALAVLRSRLVGSEVVYLLLPIAACSLALLLAAGRGEDATTRASPAVSTIAGLACAVAPLAAMIVTYAVRGQLPPLIEGLVVLPQRRLTFASAEMPPLTLFVMGLIVPALLVPLGRTAASRESLAVSVARMVLAIAIVLASLWHVMAYQLVWQSARAVAALLPVAVFWLLTSRTQQSYSRLLFPYTSMLACASLVQFPYAAPIYFCYVAPLGVITAIAAARAWIGPAIQKLLPLGVLLLAFAVLSMNRGYLYYLGLWHAPVALDTSLNLSRANLRVTESEARVYRELVQLVETHRRGGVLVAEPDSPEVYFLTSSISPRGVFFEFFSQDETSLEELNGYTYSPDISVVVVNHQPYFTPEPSRARVVAARREFPQGQRVGRFEVRWR